MRRTQVAVLTMVTLAGTMVACSFQPADVGPRSDPSRHAKVQPRDAASQKSEDRAAAGLEQPAAQKSEKQGPARESQTPTTPNLPTHQPRSPSNPSPPRDRAHHPKFSADLSRSQLRGERGLPGQRRPPRHRSSSRAPSRVFGHDDARQGETPAFPGTPIRVSGDDGRRAAWRLRIDRVLGRPRLQGPCRGMQRPFGRPESHDLPLVVADKAMNLQENSFQKA